VDIVLAEANLRFRKPARFDEELTLAIAVTHVGNTSVVTRHTASYAGELLAEGDRGSLTAPDRGSLTAAVRGSLTAPHRGSPTTPAGGRHFCGRFSPGQIPVR
jgi:hypothetical protein